MSFFSLSGSVPDPFSHFTIRTGPRAFSLLKEYLSLADMTTLGVREVVEVYWREIAKKCNRATVFIENAAAEW